MSDSQYDETVKTLLTCDAERLKGILAQAEYLEKGEVLDILEAVIYEARGRMQRIARRAVDDAEIETFIERHSNCFRGCSG